MSENSNEEEKLSFKEQILRDLERLKKEANEAEQTDDFFSTLADSSESTSVKKEPSISEEELIAKTVSAVDQLIDNAPVVPPRPTVTEETAEEVVESPQTISEKEEKHSIPTRVSVSYKTQDASPEETEAVSFASSKEELANENHAYVETEATERSRRSRRESVKPTKKKKKSRFKGCLVTVLVLLILSGVGGFFGLRYAKSALQPVDPNSKQYVTVQIPDGANTQQIGSALENSGVIKNGLVFALYAKYKNYTELKSGYYNLQKSMSVEDVIKELQKGGTPEPQESTLAELTIPEGYTLEQIAQTVG